MKKNWILGGITGTALMLTIVLIPIALGMALFANQSSGSEGCDDGSTGTSGSVSLADAKVYAAGDSIMVGLTTTQLGAQEPLKKKMERQAKSFSSDAFGGKNLTFGIDNINRAKLKGADIVIMEFGTNTYGPDFKSEVDRAIKMIRNEASRDVKIYWVEIFSGGPDVSQWKERDNQILKAESRITVIPTKNLGYNSQLDSSKIHPNLEGYEELANDIVTFVKTGGSSSDTSGSSSSDCGDSASTGEYINPLSDGGEGNGKWGPARTDQGVDWIPPDGAELPVKAIGRAKITYSNTNSGWPGGAFMVYRLLDGSHKGELIYVAEHLKNLKPVGTEVQAGDVIATAMGGYPWTEWGFASSPNADLARAYSCYQEGEATASGEAMARFFKELGAKPAMDPGKGTSHPEGPLC